MHVVSVLSAQRLIEDVYLIDRSVAFRQHPRRSLVPRLDFWVLLWPVRGLLSPSLLT